MKKHFFDSRRVSALSVVADAFLCVIKLVVGSLTGSHALVCDGVHSCADVVSSLVVFFGSRLSHRGATVVSPKKIEAITLFLLSVFLGTSGVIIGTTGLCEIIGFSKDEPSVVSFSALCVSVTALAVKVALSCLTLKIAKKENNDILLANARHHQTDVFSSVAGLFGVVAACVGFSKFDILASLAICLFVIKTAIDIFKKSKKAHREAENFRQHNELCVQNKQK